MKKSVLCCSAVSAVRGKENAKLFAFITKRQLSLWRCPIAGVWAQDNPMKPNNLHCKPEEKEEEVSRWWLYANTKESKRRLFLSGKTLESKQRMQLKDQNSALCALCSSGAHHCESHTFYQSAIPRATCKVTLTGTDSCVLSIHPYGFQIHKNQFRLSWHISLTTLSSSSDLK